MPGFHGSIALALPHLVAGVVGLAAGAVALLTLKGEGLHRKSGMVFVYAMLVVSLSGVAMAVAGGQKLNLIGGLLTFYLVTTSVLTIRRPHARSLRAIEVGALLLALAIGALGYSVGFEASRSATGRIDGLPPAPAFMFGSVALLAAVGDVRVISYGVNGRRRLTRHLWRMCFALFAAVGSFFPAQLPKLLPSLRQSAVVWVPPLVVLLVMAWWLWRVRVATGERAVFLRYS
jgi:uncharacterized membrane protein